MTAAPPVEDEAITYPDPDSLPTIWIAFAAAKRAIRPVAKDSHNEQQHFDFRGVDAVVNAAAPELDRHGIVIVPQLLKVTYGTVEVGQKRTLMANVRIKVRYRFTGPRGDHFDVEVPGEAMDSGDKGVAKAMSVAYRIALLQALNLPTSDPDVDSTSYERSPRREADQSWRDQPPVNRPRNQQPPQPPALDPLPDDDPWKDAIGDITGKDEANNVFGQIVEQVRGGQMTEARGTVLQNHVRARMATLARLAAESGSPTPDQGTDPAVPGQDDHWQPEQASEPARPPRIRPEDQGARKPAAQATSGDDADWLSDFMQKVEAAVDVDALNQLRRAIGQAIIDKHITAAKSPDLANLIQERSRALRAAGDAA